MLSREEYERVIQAFLVELNYLCKGATEAKLRALPRFAPEINEYLADLRNPAANAAQTLYLAFAYVDEYTRADWLTVAQAGYDAYSLTQQRALAKAHGGPDARKSGTAEDFSAPAEHVILHGVRWPTYESLLADFARRSVPHFAFDRGTLEIVRPSAAHERRNRTLAQLVHVLAEERDVDAKDYGSTTLRRPDLECGFDPDTCFYVETAGRIRLDADGHIDLRVSPPPDLVIEVAAAAGTALNKLPLYAQVGVPEVWRDTGEQVNIFARRDANGYDEAPQSLAFPGLTGARLTEFISASERLERLDWLRAVRSWAREHGRDNSADRQR